METFSPRLTFITGKRPRLSRASGDNVNGTAEGCDSNASCHTNNSCLAPCGNGEDFDPWIICGRAENLLFDVLDNIAVGDDRDLITMPLVIKSPQVRAGEGEKLTKPVAPLNRTVPNIMRGTVMDALLTSSLMLSRKGIMSAAAPIVPSVCSSHLLRRGISANQRG